MSFVAVDLGPSRRPILQKRKGISALRPAVHTTTTGGFRLTGDEITFAVSGRLAVGRFGESLDDRAFRARPAGFVGPALVGPSVRAPPSGARAVDWFSLWRWALCVQGLVAGFGRELPSRIAGEQRYRGVVDLLRAQLGVQPALHDRGQDAVRGDLALPRPGQPCRRNLDRRQGALPATLVDVAGQLPTDHVTIPLEFAGDPARAHLGRRRSAMTPCSCPDRYRIERGQGCSAMSCTAGYLRDVPSLKATVRQRIHRVPVRRFDLHHPTRLGVATCRAISLGRPSRCRVNGAGPRTFPLLLTFPTDDRHTLGVASLAGNQAFPRGGYDVCCGSPRPRAKRRGAARRQAAAVKSNGVCIAWRGPELRRSDKAGGAVHSRHAALEHRRAGGWHIAADRSGWRRVVASPGPVRSANSPSSRNSLSSGQR